MTKIIKDGPAEIDMTKVKETMVRERETQIKENSFWLSYLQNHYMNGIDILSLDEYTKLVNSFTAKKVKAVAKKYLDTKDYVRVALTPKGTCRSKIDSEQTVQLSVDLIDHFAEMVLIVGEVIMVCFNDE